MKNSSIYYINGKYFPENKAKISVLDIGLLRGFGVFDFLVTYNGKSFLTDEHIERLFNSAKAIGLDIGKSTKQIKDIIQKTLSKNAFAGEKTVRIIVTGGVGESSVKPASRSSIFVIIEKRHIYPKDLYEKGVKAITFDHTRALARAKSLDYSIGVKALQLANKKRAIEAVYVNSTKNSVTEATTSNVFIVKKSKIFTPNNNILNGITRDLVIKLCKKQNSVIEKPLKLTELLSADEVFITASNKEVMPVVQIDNKKVGDGRVGPVTKWVIKTFKDFVESGNW